MASNVTLLNMRTQARQRSNQENSQFVSDSEFNIYINQSIKELYDLLVSKSEEYYFSMTSIVTNGTTDTYTLPSDFYKFLSIDYNPGSNTPVSMQRFNFEERHFYNHLGSSSVVKYRLLGNSIKFVPIPTAQTMTLYYIPTFANLANDNDTFDGINGWEEFVVIDAAIKALAKEESDISVLAAQKNAIVARINAINERDLGHADRVTDVRRSRSGRCGWEDAY